MIGDYEDPTAENAEGAEVSDDGRLMIDDYGNGV